MQTRRYSSRFENTASAADASSAPAPGDQRISLESSSLETAADADISHPTPAVTQTEV